MMPRRYFTENRLGSGMPTNRKAAEHTHTLVSHKHTRNMYDTDRWKCHQGTQKKGSMQRTLIAAPCPPPCAYCSTMCPLTRGDTDTRGSVLFGCDARWKKLGADFTHDDIQHGILPALYAVSLSLLQVGHTLAAVKVYAQDR